jgi:alpha-galactosidase
MRTMKILILSTLLSLACGVFGADTIWLSSLDMAKVSQGWGVAQPDQSVTQTPLSVGGMKFAHGVGTHADSRMYVELNGGTEMFSALCGVDDNAKSVGSAIVFRVYADGMLLWHSPEMKKGDQPVPMRLPVRGVKALMLTVQSVSGAIDFCHADWLTAQFTVTGETPRTVIAPREEAVILTPKPSPKPRINGPKIFGARPGSPFLYKIPATGEKPLRYAVSDLPKGLRVDETTGLITGVVDKAGDYWVTFKVSNKLGTDRVKFKISCGQTLALTPHMGWNSWYVWEGHVTDKIMRAAADAMVSNGMIDHGYMYVNIDDCWPVKAGASDPSLGGEPRDAQGRINANRRFPDMKALTDYIHSKGLKAGIYTSPGPTTCAGFTAAWEHEALDAQRYAEWGFDFLKYDWCSYGSLAKDNTVGEFRKPYDLMGRLLKEQKRDIVLNLCQYGMGDVWKWGKSTGGHSWRTAGDLGSSFEQIGTKLFHDGFDVYAQNDLHRYGGSGGWNDPDYLLLGYLSNWQGQTAMTPLTPNEQYTHVSLWCLVAAPLIFSGDITRMDDFTLSLLTNDEVLDVDQDALGRPGRRVSKDGDIEIWTRDLADGSKAVGLFNRGEMTATVTAPWTALGLKGKHPVRDLWRQQEMGTHTESYKAAVPRHGVVLIKVR